jgi:hypothetical protein
LPEDFAAEHGQVLAEAQDIYINRSKVRGQMWLETSIERELRMVEEKMNRAKAALLGGADGEDGLEDPDRMKEFIDSCIDGMNFFAFAVKKARRGKRF